MSLEEIEILKERAEKILDERRASSQKWHLRPCSLQRPAFLELYLKYKLFLLVGDYPKTHSIKKLLKEIGKAAGKFEEIRKFMIENIDGISNLENAYITSRYIPTEFEREEVENMLRLAKKIRELVDEL